MATFRALGNFVTAAYTAGSLSVPLPTGYQAGDILILIVRGNYTANTNANVEWTECYSSPVQRAPTPVLKVYWRRATGDANDACNITIANPDRALARIIAFSGCVTTGTPIGNTNSSQPNSPGAYSIGSIDTTQDDQLVIVAVGQLYDGATAPYFSISNDNLIDKTILFSDGTSDGGGGQLGGGYGTKETAGAIGTTSGSFPRNVSTYGCAWIGSLLNEESIVHDQTLDSIASGTVSLIKQISKEIPSTSLVVSNISKGISKNIEAISTTISKIAKSIAKEMTSIANTTAMMTASKVYTVVMESIANTIATITKKAVFVYDVSLESISNATAVISKIVGKNIKATVVTVSNIDTKKIINVILEVVSTSIVKIKKEVTKSLVSSSEVTVKIIKQVNKTIASGVEAIGLIIKRNIIARTISSVASTTATVIASRAVTLAASVVSIVKIDKIVGKLLTVRANVIAVIRHPFWKLKYPTHGDSEEYNVKYSKQSDTYTEKYVAHGDGEDYNKKYNNHD